MPLLTVRLSDEEHAALKAMAGERGMAGMVKGWIAGGPQEPIANVHGYTCDLCSWGRDKAQGIDTYAIHLRKEHTSPPTTGTDHQACDRRITELEDAVRRAKARYDPLLGILMSIYATTAKQKDTRQYIIYEDLVIELRRVVDEEAPF